MKISIFRDFEIFENGRVDTTVLWTAKVDDDDCILVVFPISIIMFFPKEGVWMWNPSDQNSHTMCDRIHGMSWSRQSFSPCQK